MTRLSRRLISITLGFFLLSLVAGCHQAAPAPQYSPPPADTRTPTTTPAPSLTPSATPTPTFPPEFTPTNYIFPTAVNAQSYRLRPYSLDETFKTIQELDPFTCYASSGTHQHIPAIYECGDFSFYQASLYAEALSRSPADTRGSDLAKSYAAYSWEWLTHLKYAKIHAASTKPFRQLTEEALNSGETTPEDLGKWFEANHWNLKVVSSISQVGLMERGAPAWIFNISNEDLIYSIFVLEKSSSGSFHLVALSPSWDLYWKKSVNLSIQDLNHNNRPEITVLTQMGGSGHHPYCQVRYDAFEWNGSELKSLFSQPFSEGAIDCAQISFKPDVSGVQVIHTQTVTWFNGCKLHGYNFIVDETYRWNGQAYGPPEVKPRPLSSSELNPNWMECILGWALQAGLDDTQAHQAVLSALPNWTTGMDDLWGPASKDYFLLRLGLWEYQNGDLSKARSRLEQLRDHPVNPDYPQLSQLAGHFLAKEIAIGAVAAAQTLDRELKWAYDQYISSGSYTFDTDPLRKAWGFADPDWTEGDFFYLDPSPFFAQSLKIAHLGSKSDLVDWAKQQQISLSGLEEADVDGDGLKDWIFLASTSNFGEYYDLWTVLQKPSGPVAVKINNIGGRYTLNPSRAEVIETTVPDHHRMVFYQWAGQLLAFHLVFQSAGPQAVIDFRTSHPYEVDAKVDNFRLKKSPDTVLLTVQWNDGADNYRWDDKSAAWIAQGFSIARQEENIAQAEKLIYQDQQPEKATALLKDFLNRPIREDYIWASGVDIINPPRIRPYALYLLGLAYELSGDTNQAVQTYLQLWREYPDNPASLIVRHKLEAMP
jgi:hypothetical protein